MHIMYGKNIYQNGWEDLSVRRFIRKYEQTGSLDRRPGSGCPRAATTQENAEIVGEKISSQETPGTHQVHTDHDYDILISIIHLQHYMLAMLAKT